MTKPNPNKTHRLVGKFFHSLEDEKIVWQGKILGEEQPGIYIIQLFSWLSGEPSNQRIIRIEEMNEWYFYDTQECLIFSAEHGSAKHFLP